MEAFAFNQLMVYVLLIVLSRVIPDIASIIFYKDGNSDKPYSQ